MSLSGLRRLCVYLFSLGGISAPTRSTGRKYQREIILFFYLETLGQAHIVETCRLRNPNPARSKVWLHHRRRFDDEHNHALRLGGRALFLGLCHQTHQSYFAVTRKQSRTNGEASVAQLQVLDEYTQHHL